MLFLYVDDDIDDYFLFQETLSRVAPSASVINARDGREALEMLEQLTKLPDTIFLDINMPTMDGKSCLKTIKVNERFKDIPVFIYTTSVNEKDRNQCLQLGATEYLVKPFGVEETEQQLQRVLAPFTAGK